jgi:hypothetical protein
VSSTGAKLAGWEGGDLMGKRKGEFLSPFNPPNLEKELMGKMRR